MNSERDCSLGVSQASRAAAPLSLPCDAQFHTRPTKPSLAVHPPLSLSHSLAVLEAPILLGQYGLMIANAKEFARTNICDLCMRKRGGFWLFSQNITLKFLLIKIFNSFLKIFFFKNFCEKDFSGTVVV